MKHFETSAIGAFADELHAALPLITAALDAAEQSGDPGSLAEAQRLLHSLKGAAGMVGLPTLAYLLNLAEDVAERNHAASPGTADGSLPALRATLPQLAGFLASGASGTVASMTPHVLTLAEQLRGDAPVVDSDTLEKLLDIDLRELATAALVPAQPVEDTGGELSLQALPDDAFAVPLASLADDSLDAMLTAFSEAASDAMLTSLDPLPTEAPEPAGASIELPSFDELPLSDLLKPEWPSLLTLEGAEQPLTPLEMALAPAPGEWGIDSALPDGLDEPAALALAFGDLGGESLTLANLPLDQPAAIAPAAPPPEASAPLAVDLDLAPAEDVPAELAEVFAQEAAEHLQTIARITSQLSPASTDRDAVQELRRAVHTLKGAAGVVGYKAAAKLAHSMEDLLDRLYEETAQLTDAAARLLAVASDALDEAINGGGDATALRATIARLLRQFEMLVGGEPAVAQAPAVPAADGTISVPAAAPEPTPGDAAPVEERRVTVDRRAAPNVLRVPVARLDDLVRSVSELVLNRSTFEQHYSALLAQVEELKFSAARIRKVAQKLEADYEVRALAGNALSGGGHGFDELEFDRYTDFHLLTRELTETASDVATVSARVSDSIGDFESDLTRLGRLTREIQDKTMEFRMLPLRTLTTRLERTVRVTADACGKQVEFAIEGEDVTLDKSLLEHMADPLLHLLRNAVDHGIESPEVRRDKGKSERGRIVVRAFHDGTDVVIEVEDDGKGLDVDRIRRTAVERGLVGDTVAAGLAPEALFDFIFEPGFSTASRVSEISGRGVGMDVVKSAVVRAGGRIQIDSRPGAGVTMAVRAPMTLAITRVLLVRAGGEVFGLPLGAVVQIVRPHPTAISQVGPDRVLTVDGRPHRLRDLADVLGLPRASEAPATQPVLIANLSGRRIALAVDAILHSRDAVVKSLGTHLRRVRGIWGATLLGDGTVVLILNAADLGGEENARVRVVSRPAAAPLASRTYTVLVVDDSLSMRHVLSTTIKKAGWNVLQARDGLDALEIVHRSSQPPDAILLDVEMPRMDGYEFLATIRTQQDYGALPIVMLTSRGSEKHREKAKSLGATGYLVKPFREDVLIETIERLVQASRQTDREKAS